MKEENAVELLRHLKVLVEQYSCTVVSEYDRELSKAQFRAIETLGDRGPSKMNELAESMSLAMSTVTGIMDSLVKNGLVARERSQEDRRIVLVTLTELGEAVYQAHEKAFVGLCGGMLETLNESEQGNFLILLRKIITGFDIKQEAV